MPVHGISHGIHHGIGRGPSRSAGITGVSKDATSNIYVPANSTEWANFISGGGLAGSVFTPDVLWLLQEASGNPADSIGTFPLTATGTWSYQQAVTGWARKMISSADGTANTLRNTSVSLPNISTNSCTIFAIVKMPGSNPAGTREVVFMGATTTRGALDLTTAGKQFAFSSANNLVGSANFADGNVHPVLVKVDRTGSVTTAYTDIEKLTPTFGGTMAGQILGLGAGNNNTVAGGYLYGCSWFNSHAEMSDTTARSFLQRLGFTVLW